MAPAKAKSPPPSLSPASGAYPSGSNGADSIQGDQGRISLSGQVEIREAAPLASKSGSQEIFTAPGTEKGS